MVDSSLDRGYALNSLKDSRALASIPGLITSKMATHVTISPFKPLLEHSRLRVVTFGILLSDSILSSEPMLYYESTITSSRGSLKGFTGMPNVSKEPSLDILDPPIGRDLVNELKKEK